MRLPQIRDPSSPSLDTLPDSYKAKVCVCMLWFALEPIL